MNARGGDSHWKVVWGRSALKTPFSHYFLALETHHFKPNSCRLWLSFGSWDTNFGENLFRRPSFKPKISSGNPTFENLGGTYLLKKFLSTPQREWARLLKKCTDTHACTTTVRSGLNSLPSWNHTDYREVGWGKAEVSSYKRFIHGVDIFKKKNICSWWKHLWTELKRDGV